MNIDQLTHDRTVFAALQIALLLLSLVAIGQELWGKRRVGTGAGIRATATVIRGDRSMNFLYVVYGVATVVYTLGIQVAETLHGYKVLFLVLDYLAFTYLFFFNSWFRNRLFGVQDRIQKD